MLQEFSDWLSQSSLTALFSDTTRIETWLIIPLSQSLHILGVAFIMIAVGMLNLRLLGVGVSHQSFGKLCGQLVPWVWAALALLLVTGIVQTIAEPSREIMNITFRTKMVMLLVTIAITAFYQIRVNKDVRYWERSAERQDLGRVLASLSLVLWVGILAAGRVIAYFGAIEQL
jgi:uncharacterized protein DUF6644